MAKKKKTSVGDLDSRLIPKKLLRPFTDEVKKLMKTGLREGPKLQQAIVDMARPQTSMFHCLFEWDNDIAAEAYRREQARFYVKSVKVIIQTSLTFPDVKVKTFNSVKLPTSNAREYFTVNEARTRIDVNAELRRQLRSDAMVFMQKYSNYKSVFGIRLATVLQEMQNLINNLT